MKTFRKIKSSERIKKEAELQSRAANYGIAPEIHDINTVAKYIVMKKMDKHLLEVMKKEGCLAKKYQKQIINIYKQLDEANVFHADANLLNYMFLDKKLYIIDFGMAKQITNSLIKKLGTTRPNLHIMTLGLILKLKEMGYKEDSWSYLINFINDEHKTNFRIA